MAVLAITEQTLTLFYEYRSHTQHFLTYGRR
jgi:hypothetical protein